MADTTPSTGSGDKLGTGLFILSILFWPLGAILYFVYKGQNQPAKAKSDCNGALIGLGLIVLFYIVVFVLVGLFGERVETPGVDTGYLMSAFNLLRA